jgi:alkylated DNA repair dioxygenase AlkB
MQLQIGNLKQNNLLPIDGQVNYHPIAFSTEEVEAYFTYLANEIAWQQDVVKLFGKTYITDRKVAWYAEKPFIYRYSGQSKIALPFSPTLLDIKSRVEKLTGSEYDACLLNYYHNGSEGMGWHSDNEKSISPNSSIASVSLGATRKFQFKHKIQGLKLDLILDSGSILDMRGETQEFWLHALPKSKKIAGTRINLTFRKMADSCEIGHA